MDAQVIDLARNAERCFLTSTRDNGETFVKLTDEAPQWVSDLVWAAHDNGEVFPDDWRYATIREALDRIIEADEDKDADELSDEFADDVDVYNADLLQWVGSTLTRAAYVDEAREEYGEARDFYHGLQMGQYLERQEVFDAVFSFLTNEAKDRG